MLHCWEIITLVLSKKALIRITMNEVTKAALGTWLFVWPIYFPSIWSDWYLPTVTASSFPPLLNFGTRSDYRAAASTRTIYKNTVCKLPIISIPEAEITKLLSSLDHNMSTHKLHIPRNCKAKHKFKQSNPCQRWRGTAQNNYRSSCTVSNSLSLSEQNLQQ